MVFVCVGCEAVMQRSAVVHGDGQQVFSLCPGPKGASGRTWPIRFAEAVSLYDAAISIDPSKAKASYRSNKRAALTALGSFSRQRLNVGKLFASTRFTNGLTTDWLLFISGEPGKATYHFKQAGSDADPDAMNKAKKVEFHLEKCSEAKRQQYWNILIKETIVSTAAGADSAPLILALKAEALMKLNRNQEAIETMELLVVHAQVDMIEGRFDDAVAAAERALRLDAKNGEANGVLRRTDKQMMLYPHASISCTGAFEWTLKKIVRSNASCFKILLLHVEVPDDDGFDDEDRTYGSAEDIQLPVKHGLSKAILENSSALLGGYGYFLWAEHC
ncbi:hypothetical protein CASFOL_004631 [Castilleja foliolosa]|uniref:Uncharacterized protein n=1 Tax=Castilleja foliolosa TaxID=1961234 RepID=A0ABD3EBQ8_9LAMI